MANERQAIWAVSGEEPIPFPIFEPTHGRGCVDIRTLGARSGCFAYDSGFESTAGCKSKITFVDGEKGELLYRGYPIEQLAAHCDFLEVAYLLQDGELPDVEQRHLFESTIRRHAAAHEQMVKLYQGFRRDADPMAVMVGVVGALSAFYHDAGEFSDAAQRRRNFHRVVAKMPAIVAMAYKYSVGRPFMSPRADLCYAANFLYMMFATPCEAYDPNPVLVRAVDRLLIVHADHGQDAPTATVRMAGSSGANPFACISAAIACLSGPAHGGAGEACLAMLHKIGDVSRLTEYIARAADKDDDFEFVGFGDGVYRDFDPRAELLHDVCHEVVREQGLENDRFFVLARALEQAALAHPYFVDSLRYPNVDFYSAVILKAIGVPASMITCVYALARTAGWMAQWEEMATDPEYKIGRPRQLYVGLPRRTLPLSLPS